VLEAGKKKLSTPSKGANSKTKNGADRSSALVRSSKEVHDFATCHKTFVFLGFMSGTTGLEPATSAVTVHRFEVFQRLTNPWGTPKTTEVVQDLAFCGSDCGSGFLSLPALPRRRARCPVGSG
jgi:hypothetical protein